MAWLLDTNAWIDYLKNPKSNVRARLMSETPSVAFPSPRRRSWPISITRNSTPSAPAIPSPTRGTRQGSAPTGQPQASPGVREVRALPWVPGPPRTHILDFQDAQSPSPVSIRAETITPLQITRSSTSWRLMSCCHRRKLLQYSSLQSSVPMKTWLLCPMDKRPQIFS